MHVREYCIRIHQLLSDFGESRWLYSFKGFIAELEEHGDTSVYRKIISIYGGAGSFSDLVLYKDGSVCIEGNDKLEQLRNGLYDKVAEEWN